MFAAEAKAVIKQVGAHGELISNSNLNQKMDLLTLVRVTEGRFWSVPKYKPMECSLPDLMDEPDFSPGIEEEVLVKDFTTNIETSGTGNVEGGHGEWGEAKVKGSTDTVDGMASPVSMMKKKANIKTVRTKFNNRKIKTDKLKMLGLKDRDKLLFVHQTVYNTGPVKLIRKSKRDGSISASCQKMLSLLVMGSRKEETSFTVPEKSTFAYGLTEIRGLEEDTLKISYEPWVAHRSPLDMFNNDASSGENTNSNVNLEQVKEGVEMKLAALQPLADVPVSTRRDLLRTLGELLKDGDDLTLLEQTLEQCSKGVFECPQSQPVASFMDLLDVSNASTALKDAVHLLVSAMDILPDGAPVLLATCCPDTLTVLNQLVDGLMEDGDTKLPESLPPPLQEEGELRWAGELLCSTNQTLTELSDQWDNPEVPPGVLLEVLGLVVRGLSLMQL